MEQSWKLRTAEISDVDALEDLIIASCTEILKGHYTEGQIQAALGIIFGVDTQLIEDKTYYVCTDEAGAVVACGGWSFRTVRCGGKLRRLAPQDGAKICCGTEGEQPEPGKPSEKLVPGKDSARIRAFFVHPAWARKGLGKAIINACEKDIIASGFKTIDIAATVCGDALYRAMGYVRTGEEYVALANGQPPMHVIHLHKDL